MFIFYLYISPYIITHFLHLINRFFCLTEKISGIFLLIKAFGRGRSLIHLCGSNSTYTSIIKQQQQDSAHYEITAVAVITLLLFFIYIYIPLYYNTFCAPLQWNKLLNNIKIAAIILIAHFFLRL